MVTANVAFQCAAQESASFTHEWPLITSRAKKMSARRGRTQRGGELGMGKYRQDNGGQPSSQPNQLQLSHHPGSLMVFKRSDDDDDDIRSKRYFKPQKISLFSALYSATLSRSLLWFLQAHKSSGAHAFASCWARRPGAMGPQRAGEARKRQSGVKRRGTKYELLRVSQ